ncbi:MAG: hypothetical protein ABDH91_07250 [Bacteroidia bacterium]
MRWDLVPRGEVWRKRWGELVRGGRLPAASLWIGPEGVGKTLAAWALARALLCERGDFVGACEACSSCRATAQWLHPHLLVAIPLPAEVSWEEGLARWRAALQANPYLTFGGWLRELGLRTSARLSIGVEVVRRLQERLSLALTASQWRVVVFWHAETLTRQASNALLKLVEEPPARTFFLFLSTRLEALPITLRSRCQVWRFSPLSPQELEALAGTAIPPTLLPLAQGSFGRLKEILAEGGTAFLQPVREWLRALWAGHAEALLAPLESLAKSPQLSELLLGAAFLVRAHPHLTPFEKAYGMDLLLQAADEIEAHIQPPLVLWQTTLALWEAWRGEKPPPLAWLGREVSS